MFRILHIPTAKYVIDYYCYNNTRNIVRTLFLDNMKLSEVPKTVDDIVLFYTKEDCEKYLNHFNVYIEDEASIHLTFVYEEDKIYPNETKYVTTEFIIEEILWVL